jgi:hypothetical protein
MRENKDKVVANVYETFDYDKFAVLAENRGQKEFKGIKEKKITSLQKMIDAGTWIHEMSRVKVNVAFQIIDGAHTFEVARRNHLSIRYEITDDPHFNEVTKREMVGNVYNINSITTSWTSKELFEAACQTKAPLALLMKDILEANDNFFVWTDLQSLLEKDGRHFVGRWRGVTMQTFEDRNLIEYIQSNEFELELKFFVKFNLKARIAVKKGLILKAAYDILWHAREHVNPSMFRKSLVSIPESWVQSAKTSSDDKCRRLLIHHYNKSQGQSVNISSVTFAVKHKGVEEPVLEILGL